MIPLDRTIQAPSDERHPLPATSIPGPRALRLERLLEFPHLRPLRLERGRLAARLNLEDAEPAYLLRLGLQTRQEAGEGVRREVGGRSLETPSLRQETNSHKLRVGDSPLPAPDHILQLPPVATILEGLPREASSLRGLLESVRPRHRREATR